MNGTPDSAVPGPLGSVRVLTLAVNVPGPAAAARLRDLGASVVKVEPPGRDPLSRFNTAWYRSLVSGQEVVRLDLKEPEDRLRLDEYLGESDLLLTSSRPGALARLGLSPEELRREYPNLCGVAITGYPGSREDEPGHDLTYMAKYGLLSPPELPRTLLADLAGAERAVTAALALLFERERGSNNGARHAVVPLSEAAAFFGEPWRLGITRPGAELGGGLSGYNLYKTSDGWIAVAALEEHFWRKLQAELGLEDANQKDLQEVFRRQTAEHWEEWAAERDLPVAALRGEPTTQTMKEAQ